MATLHHARLSPTKLEILSTWLPAQEWYPGEDSAELTSVGSCRFDDPAGEVGVETLFVRLGDDGVVHVPMTYRGEPLEGADDALMATMEHSVLGRRWVYDACADPVYVTAAVAVIAGHRKQAEEVVESGDAATRREPTATLVGGSAPVDVPTSLAVDDVAYATEGDVTICRTPTFELRVLRVPRPAAPAAGSLTGTWTGQSEPMLLATASST